MISTELRQHWLRIVLLALAVMAALAFLPGPVLGANVLELKVGETTYRGRLEARGKQSCWLLSEAGQLDEIEYDSVTSFEKLDRPFRSQSVVDLRERYKRRYGTRMRVEATQHYVVAAPAETGRKYVELFESVYRSFHHYFSVRRFQVGVPEFPLVAIVFPNFAQFRDYAKGDEIRATPGLKGYYHRLTNCVALYDDGTDVTYDQREMEPVSFADYFLPGNSQNLGRSLSRPSAGMSTYASLNGSNLESTIVHEAIHQVAFNTGLHARIGENPRWVVEGLATVLEAPGMREGAGTNQRSRLNPERFNHFGSYMENGRPTTAVETIVRSDDVFGRRTLDAYSEAWALSFYLIENYPLEYGRYLRGMAQRDSLKAYTGDQRVEDFKRAFGHDLAWIDTQLVRHIERQK